MDRAALTLRRFEDYRLIHTAAAKPIQGRLVLLPAAVTIRLVCCLLLIVTVTPGCQTTLGCLDAGGPFICEADRRLISELWFQRLTASDGKSSCDMVSCNVPEGLRGYKENLGSEQCSAAAMCLKRPLACAARPWNSRIVRRSSLLTAECCLLPDLLSPRARCQECQRCTLRLVHGLRTTYHATVRPPMPDEGRGEVCLHTHPLRKYL